MRVFRRAQESVPVQVVSVELLRRSLPLGRRDLPVLVHIGRLERRKTSLWRSLGLAGEFLGTKHAVVVGVQLLERGRIAGPFELRDLVVMVQVQLVEVALCR